MDRIHFLLYVIDPALAFMSASEPRFAGDVPRALLLGTALHESKLRYLRQLGHGPALGIFQMEPATHDWLWEKYAKNPDMLAMLRGASVTVGEYYADVEELCWNLRYAAIMARLRYWVTPQKLPGLEAEGLARYWKTHYNTVQGAGTVDKALPAFKAAAEIVRGTAS